MIVNALNDEPHPVYWKGENVRDWLYVEDHCYAIDLIIRNGHVGEIYNTGGRNEMRNIDIVKLICRELGKPETLITYVTDRKGERVRILDNLLRWKERKNAQKSEAETWENTGKIR